MSLPYRKGVILPPVHIGYPAEMAEVESTRGGGRETRLLLVTIAVSVAALLALAQFRFPEQSARPADPAPAPLERLAARAAYDELASAMADLERRLAPRVLIYRVSPARPSGEFVVAPRVTSSRAVVVLDEDETLHSVGSAVNPVTHDVERGLAVLMIATGDDAVVTPRTGAPRAGPRYVVVVEGTAQGPTLRPVYVGRTSTAEGRDGPVTLISMDALQGPVARGSAIFSLEGTFIGLVRETGPVTSLFTAESLRSTVEAAQFTTPHGQGDLGVDVEDASPLVLRAAGAEAGAVVTHVRKGGPAQNVLRPGDVVSSVDDVPTTSAEAFRHAARTRAPGAPTTVRFVRRGTTEQATFRAADTAATPAVDGLGISARSVPGVGVEIVSVEPGGPGDRAGLLRGDVVQTMDGLPLTDTKALMRAFDAAKPQGLVLLSIERGRQRRILAVEKR